jgi:protocatechuate 3,4-dioxygenase beta subunit
VALTATHAGTGLAVQLVSDAAGRYAFRNLPPGPYSLAASREGFREHRTSGIPVTAGNPVHLDVTLAVGGWRSASNSPARRRSWGVPAQWE